MDLYDDLTEKYNIAFLFILICSPISIIYTKMHSRNTPNRRYYPITAFSTSSPCSSSNTFPKARMVDKLENIRNPKSLTDFPAEMKSGKNKICLYTAFSDLLEAKNGIGPEVEYVCHADYTAYRAEEKIRFCIARDQSPIYAEKRGRAGGNHKRVYERGVIGAPLSISISFCVGDHH